MKQLITSLQKRIIPPRNRLLILGFWGLGILLSAHTVRVMWDYNNDKTRFNLNYDSSDWRSGFEWVVYDDGGDFNEWEWGNGHPNNQGHLPITDNSGNYIGNQLGPIQGYMILGPGVSITTNIRAEFGSGSIDDNYGNILFRTQSIYRPSSVEVTGFGISVISIKWGKGTDMPDSETEYIIQLDGVSIDTVSGQTRTYDILGLSPNTTHTIGVATYTDGGSHIYNNFKYATWNRQTSPFRTISQSTEDFSLTASDGDFASRVRLKWNKVSGNDVTDFRILRSLLPPNQSDFEELTILNRQATAHNDYDAIPGFVYEYRIQALNRTGDTLAELSDMGYGKPVGSIQGKIYTKSRVGEKGVRVCAVPKNPIVPAGAPGLPQPDPDSGFCVSSTVTGRYDIRNLYFYDSASFIVTPYYKDHIFDPMHEEIILDLSTKSVTNLNFVDTTALSIGGRVFFPMASTFDAKGTDTIPLQDATILIDGVDNGIRTDARGHWEYAISDSGEYRFKAVFKDHNIRPLPNIMGPDSVVLTIADDNLDINFLDLQTDSIDIRAQDACGGALANGDTIKIDIEHKLGKRYLEKSIKVDPQGFAEITLPATDFKVTFAKNQPITLDPNIEAQLDSLDFELNLAERDSIPYTRIDTLQSIIPADTLIVKGDTVYIPPIISYKFDTIPATLTPQPIAHFLYYAPFRVGLDWEEVGAIIIRECGPTGPNASDSVILLNSTETYRLNIMVYDSEKGCLLDTGNVQIFDYISDREKEPVDIPISQGISVYNMLPGEPNTFLGGSHPYEKPFFLNISAGSRLNQPFLYWGLVQGTDELTPTFTTRSPELPDLIIHDPPGDGSYAWVEKNSTYVAKEDIKVKVRDDKDGYYTDILLGAAGKTSLGLGAEVSFEVGAGITQKSKVLFGEGSRQYMDNTFTYTFTENFSTSDDPNFTGHDGDVYIGKATNQRYSIARVLLYDTTTCMASVQNRPNLEQTGIATTFMYTEKHINNILVPQLKFLELSFRREMSRTTDPDEKQRLKMEADSFMVDGQTWNNIVAQNARRRDTIALETKKNISFSAGSPYQSTVTMDTTRTYTYDYVDYTEGSYSMGFKWTFKGGGLWTEGELGYANEFRKETQVGTGRDTSSSFTVGYHLADNNLGDYFSVDILQDTFHNVPAFRLWGGTSSCPHEEGTQPRDKAKIIVVPPRVDNVKPGELAHFTATITNRSESFEQREYHIRTITRSNPHGAVVRFGGSLINSSPVSFFLDTLGYDIAMTVERGPRAFNYNQIGIMMYPPCEYELWENNGQITGGDTAWISVNYQTECSPVNIVRPTNNWFINDQSGPILAVDFGGYELNNPYLETITLEYKRQGTDWKDGPSVPKDSLRGELHRVLLDFTTFMDGKYWLRARADCSSNQGVLYSPEFEGIVDRYSTAPFGRSFPADGFLRKNQDILVKWDQPIDTAFSNTNRYFAAPRITLRRKDTDAEIPFTISWNADSTYMYINPVADVFTDPTLMGVEFRARVEGVRSGILPDQDFQVYPVTWDFQVNTSPVFWEPDWVEEVMERGTPTTMGSRLQNITKLLKTYEMVRYPSWVVPSDTAGTVLPYSSRYLEFAVQPGLSPGTYQDTVVVLIDGIPEYLTLSLEVNSKVPLWRVDPDDFNYEMKMILAISLDSTDTNLSRDERDMVGAFYNGECRGFARLEYVPEVDMYLAYMTVYSVPASGERMYFRIWRAETGEYFESKDSLIFYSNMSIGRITSPHILHPEYSFQVIPLEKGWNWVSFNIENADMSVENLLRSLGSSKKGNAVTVKRKDGHTSTFRQQKDPYLYFADQWSGELTQLDLARSYMIHLSEKADTLWMPGNPATVIPAQNIYSGWNWVGFPEQRANGISNALSEATFYNRDLVTSQYATAEYRATDGTWLGNLQMLKPGEGYRLLLSQGRRYDPLQYSRTVSPDYIFDHTPYESSMTIIGEITFADAYDLPLNRLIIGAFIEDSCRGTGQVEWVESLQEYRIIFSIAGNPIDVGKEIIFKLFDSYTGQEIIADTRETFNIERILGTMENPVALFNNVALMEKGYFLEQNLPNPFSDQTSIRYVLPWQTHAYMTVTDQLGQVIEILVNEEKPTGEHYVIFDGANLTPGVYYVTLRAGSFLASRKMVLVK